MKLLTSVELCAGAGGQADGLEEADIEHVAIVELDADACAIRDARERAIIEQSSQTRNVKTWLASRPSPKGPIVAIRRREVPVEFTYDVDEVFDAEVVRDGRSP